MAPSLGLTFGESQMATIARVLSRAFPASQFDIETLKFIAMSCAAGLFVSVIIATYGLDLSPGFF